MNLSLDEMGVAQAEAIASTVGPVDEVRASSLARAQETAAAFGQKPVVDDHFIELDYGEFDGKPLGDLPSATWKHWRSDPDFAPPGGESLNALHERVVAGLEALSARAVEENIVIATHVSPIKSAIAWALGVGAEISWRTHVAQASIHRIAIGPRGPALHSFNETSHLAHLPPT